MSDRTHKYRQLGTSDPATSAEMYARDPDGLLAPLQISTDGKLIVEGGGGGGAGGVIQGRDELGLAHDVRVDEDGRLVIEGDITVDKVGIEGKDGDGVERDVLVDTDGRLVTSLTALDSLLDPIALRADGAGRLLVEPKENSPVVLVAYDDSTPVSLSATPIGELKVVAEHGVQTKLNDGGTPVLAAGNASGDAYVAFREGTQLPVTIEDSVTVPVEVQGVAEVKATSVNFWALGKGDGPVVIPGFTDADGWFDARAFSRFSATGIGTGYTYDLAEGFVARAGTVHRVATYAELTAAITAATAGDIILLSDGVYEVPSGTLTINKSLVLIGESRDGVIIQTPAQTAPGVTHVITVDANNVEIRNLTVYHRQTAVSGGQQESCINVTAGRVGTIIDTCRITYCEFGLVMRGQFSVRSCIVEFSPTGPALPGTYRGIALYGMTADSEIIDVTASFRAGTASNTPRFMWLSGDGGPSYTGELVVARCQLGTGYVHQWIEIPALPGTAGAFSLAVIDNTFAAGNANIIFSTSGNTDVLGSLTLSGNSVARVDKGLFGTDGARTTPLVVHVAGNTASEPGTLRADYISLFADWAVTARNTVNTQYTVVGDAIIPDLGIPAETGASVLLEDHINVDVKYRVSMQEPHEHQLASGNLNQAYRQIVNPEEPKDILGIGYLRLVARDSSRDGHFAVFGSGK
jgi:hypothetical protein